MSTTTTPSQKARADRPDDAVFQAGIETRTQVMGSEFVDRAFGNATEYTMPMQEFITRNAWGNVWQRPGLDLKTRSLVTVAMAAPSCAAQSVSSSAIRSVVVCVAMLLLAPRMRVLYHNPENLPRELTVAENGGAPARVPGRNGRGRW